MHARTLALLCAAAFGAAGATGDVYAVDFARALTPPFLARLETLLGYACTETHGANGLLLYLNTSAYTALMTEHAPAIAECAAMSTDSRVEPALLAHAVPAAATAPRARARMHAGPVAAPVATASAAGGASVTVLVHAGALVDATAATWHRELAIAAGAAGVAPLAPTYVRVGPVPATELVALARALAAVPAVCYVERHLPAALTSLWASSVLQNASAISATSVGAADACSPSAECTPLWAAGLRGEGQLIAISDTGVAVDSCYFYDAAHAVPLSTSFGVVPADTGHRVVRALSTGTGGDAVDANGHGTHVCGIALGRPTPGTGDSPSVLDAPDFTGAAPAARLVFIDLQQGSGGLQVPEPYDSALLAYVYATGARIHSGSWGVNAYTYTDADRRVDAFCWTHRTFVAVFAAGNDPVPGRVLTPALAKSALAVAASMNGAAANALATSTPEYADDAYAFDWIASFSARGGTALNVAWQKPDLASTGGEYVWAAAYDGPASCSAPIGSLVLGYAGTSMVASRVAAAAALVRQYFMTPGFFGATSAFEPTSALVRAVLFASTRAARGVSPATLMGTLATSPTYVPYGRNYIQGHGLVELTRALPLEPARGRLLVLDNEHTAFSAAGQVHRYCVALSAETELVVALVYTDYPSALGGSGRATLVNDIDVRVYTDGATTPLAPNGLAGRDGLSPAELVRTSATRVRIEVEAFALGFGAQPVALALLLLEGPRTVRVNGAAVADGAEYVAHDAASDGGCSVCAGSGEYAPTCPSTTCGNGVVDAGEACDPGALGAVCCSSTCTLHVDARACQYELIDADCYFEGTCTAATAPMCTIDRAAMANRTFERGPSGACTEVLAPTPAPSAPAPTPPPPVVVCALSVDAALRARPLNAPGARICCMTHAHLADAYVDGESGPNDVLFARLARHVVAATENAERGVVASGTALLALFGARALLDGACSTTFAADTGARAAAHELINTLALYNAGTCAGNVRGDVFANATCVDESARAGAHYCSGRGAYDTTLDACTCEPAYTGTRCAVRACAAHGVGSASTCACAPGWAGGACTACAPAPLAATEYLCVGLESEHVPPTLTAYSHALVLVPSTEVAPRLAGTHYESTGARPDDARPATAGLDCACLPPAARADAATARDDAALAAYLAATESARLVLTSTALPALAPAELPPCSAAPSTRRRQRAAAVLALSLLLVLV